MSLTESPEKGFGRSVRIHGVTISSDDWINVAFMVKVGKKQSCYEDVAKVSYVIREKHSQGICVKSIDGPSRTLSELDIVAIEVRPKVTRIPKRRNT
jgi:hypothetical protein